MFDGIKQRSNTDKGRSLNTQQRKKVHEHLSNLESLCPVTEPARDVRMEGPWIVQYTDAPVRICYSIFEHFICTFMHFQMIYILTILYSNN